MILKKKLSEKEDHLNTLNVEIERCFNICCIKNLKKRYTTILSAKNKDIADLKNNNDILTDKLKQGRYQITKPGY